MMVGRCPASLEEGLPALPPSQGLHGLSAGAVSPSLLIAITRIIVILIMAWLSRIVAGLRESFTPRR